MRKATALLLVIVLLLLASATAGPATAGQPPLGGCPDDFHLHALMDHDEGHEGDHVHVGLTVDLNADGYLCVKHVDGIHVHIDNTVY